LERLPDIFEKSIGTMIVLNAQRFHAYSMKYLQLAGSASLAKDEAFFGVLNFTRL